MFFYVFIDPETITKAVEGGEMSLGRLVEVLLGFRRDCLVAETDYWRVTSEIGEKVRLIPDQYQNERKDVSELLIHLWKQYPVVVMEGDDGEEPLWSFAAKNAARDGIDLILSPVNGLTAQETGTRISSLADLHNTAFSQTRNNLTLGLTFEKGSDVFEALCQKCFSKLVRHAKKIVIIDYALGEFLSGAHYVNLPRWIHWLNTHLATPKEVTLILRTYGKQQNMRSLNSLVEKLRHEVDYQIQLDAHETKVNLPHKRFLVADHRCLDIDRGIDICDENDGLCRGVSITYAARPR